MNQKPLTLRKQIVFVIRKINCKISPLIEVKVLVKGIGID
jgi:hypothetical protein